MSSPEIKNIPLVTSGKSLAGVAHPGPHEGRFAIVTKRRAGIVMDASASGVREHAGRKRRSVRPSRVVLTPRCWRQACGNYPAGDGDKTSPLTGESTKYAVKPLRRGCRCVHRSPVCSCAHFFVRICTRDRGCSAHPAFPAPSVLQEGQRIWISSGANRVARMRMQLVIATALTGRMAEYCRRQQ